MSNLEKLWIQWELGQAKARKKVMLYNGILVSLIFPFVALASFEEGAILSCIVSTAITIFSVGMVVLSLRIKLPP